ncbi:MAG: lysylphosphatidylglycerol synthase transmembrane domain-containing protein [Gemmataceae bacterium]
MCWKRALDGAAARLRDAFRYGLIGIFFNTFLPGSVGGDIIKAAALARTQNRRTAAVATVLMDRAIALWALVWFVAISGTVFWLAGLLTGPSAAVATTILTGAYAVVAVTLAVWLALGLLPPHRAERFAGRLTRLPVVGTSAAELWRAVWMYRQRQGAVARVMLLSWVGHVGFVVAFYCCARALWSPELGALPSLADHFLFVPIGMVMQALIPTPGGAGAGEWGFAALYLLFGAAEANGVLASLVQRVFSWLLGLVGYAVYAGMRPASASRPAAVVVPLAVEPALQAASSSALAG